jgi:hypothetical protein
MELVGQLLLPLPLRQSLNLLINIQYARVFAFGCLPGEDT